MNAFKRIAIAIAIATLTITAALTLTACSGGTPTEDNGSGSEVSTYVVTLAAGDKVDCLVFDSYKAGGVTCFWGENSIAKNTTDELYSSVETVGGVERNCVVFDDYSAGGIDCDKSSR